MGFRNVEFFEVGLTPRDRESGSMARLPATAKFGWLGYRGYDKPMGVASHRSFPGGIIFDQVDDV